MPLREYCNETRCNCGKYDSYGQNFLLSRPSTQYDETLRFITHVLKKLQCISHNLNKEAECLTAAVEEGRCCFSKLLFSAQLKNNRCMAYLSSLKALHDNMIKNLKIKEAALNMHHAYLVNNSSSSVIEAVKCKIKECDTIHGNIEKKIESLLGKLEIEVIELTGFTRICPDDEFLVTLHYAEQKSRLRCKVRVNNVQVWSGQNVSFNGRLKVPLHIKVSELKRFAMWSVIGTTNVAYFRLFEENPNDIVVNANESGTIKIHLSVKWIRLFDEPSKESSKGIAILSGTGAMKRITQTNKQLTALKSLSFERSKPRTTTSFRSIPSSQHPVSESLSINECEFFFSMETSLLTTFFSKADLLVDKFEEIRQLRAAVVKVLKLLKQSSMTNKKIEADTFMDCFDFLYSDPDLQFTPSVPDGSIFNPPKSETAKQFVGHIESSHDSGFGSLPRCSVADPSDVDLMCELSFALTYHIKICNKLLSKLDQDCDFKSYTKMILSAISKQTEVFDLFSLHPNASLIFGNDVYLNCCWASAAKKNLLMVPVDLLCSEMKKQIFAVVDEEYLNSDIPHTKQGVSFIHLENKTRSECLYRKLDAADIHDHCSPASSFNEEDKSVSQRSNSFLYSNPNDSNQSNLFRSIGDEGSALEFFTRSFDLKRLQSQSIFDYKGKITSALSERFLITSSSNNEDRNHSTTQTHRSYSEDCLSSSHSAALSIVPMRVFGYYYDQRLCDSHFTLESVIEYFKKQYCVDFIFDEIFRRIFLVHLSLEIEPKISVFQFSLPFRKIGFREIVKRFFSQALLLQHLKFFRNVNCMNIKSEFIADEFLRKITKIWLEMNVNDDNLPFYSQLKSLLPEYYECGLKSDDVSHRIMCLLAIERFDMINFRRSLEALSLKDNNFEVRQRALKLLNKWRVPNLTRYSESVS